MSARRIFFLLAVSLLGFASGSIELNRVLPYEAPWLIRAKLAECSDTAGIDTLLVGSSRIHHQINPRLLDEAAAAEGLSLGSYNLAVFGTDNPEIETVFNQALRSGRSGIRFVIMEDISVEFEIPDVNRKTHRIISYHTPEQTLALLSDLWHFEAGFSDRVALAVPHLESAMTRQFRIGDWKDLHRLWVDSDAALPKIDARGYLPLSLETSAETGYLERRAKLIANPELVHQAMVYLQKRYDSGEVRRATASDLHYYRRLWRTAERYSARVILVNLPGSWVTPLDFSGTALPKHVFQFDLNDPRRYPQLFNVELWADESHLNGEGANVLTSLLASRLAQAIDGER